MRKRHQILFVALSLVLWSVPAFALFTPISSPNAAYLGQTDYIDFSLVPDSASPDYLSLNPNSITDGFLTIGFSSAMYKLSVPTSWASWSVSPNSQRQLPTDPLPVLRTDTIDPDTDNLPDTYIQSIIMTLSRPAYIFGFESEPDMYDLTYKMTASFYNGVDLLGLPIEINVTDYDVDPTPINGIDGARLFAASSTVPITRVEFSIERTNTNDPKTPFAVGAFRYSVPEPATMLLLGLGLIGLAGFRRKFGL